MYEHGKLKNLEDYFIRLGQRPGNTVYFYRINGYTEKIQEFLRGKKHPGKQNTPWI